MAAEGFQLTGEYLANGVIPVKKYVSGRTGLNVHFVGVDSQVINGYFCYGVDQPEASGIETLLWHLDSSGGLLPRPMRGDILRPVWQFHGAENPLADRDQACYVCCALGESAFQGTFSCCIYLLQNLEAVFEIHGMRSATEKLDDDSHRSLEQMINTVEGVLETPEPTLSASEVYSLSEPGEGAMAWEATLQAMFPGVKAFYNRLLAESKSKLSMKMRQCYDDFYRPENLTVIITGTIADQEPILEVLREYEEDYINSHPDRAEFKRPWSSPMPPLQPPKETLVHYVPKQANKESGATICFGWRGCPAADWEKAMALKTLTAHLAVGPLWNKYVTGGKAHRISWCQLEYVDVCSLITIHGIMSDADVDQVTQESLALIKAMAENPSVLDICEIRSMAKRVGWHYVREMESDPFQVLASGISKSERYGNGGIDQLQARLDPKETFLKLADKPLQYWVELLTEYFYDHGTFVTKVVPKVYGKTTEVKTEGSPAAEVETSGEMNYAATSRRASTRPRRRSSNPVGEESSAVIDEDSRNNNNNPQPGGLEKGDKRESDNLEGRFEEALKKTPFPFGDHAEDIAEFEKRLEVTSAFLDQVVKSKFVSVEIESYETGKAEQHPLFSLNELPFHTFLENTESSFVYMTMVVDTSHLSEATRKYVAPIVAALGAVVCPRPPCLDTDVDISNPNEFNIPTTLSDSQVSLGLNGEMMQSVFVSLVVRPDQYKWAVGMLHYLISDIEFGGKFLKFVANEASKGLASNYRMQTASEANYDCFEASEINLHSLVKMIYKPESNARLFVGRRRLDLINEFVSELELNEADTVKNVNDAWKLMTEGDQAKVVVQIAGKVAKIAASNNNDLVTPWNVFGSRKPLNFSANPLVMEHGLMKQPGEPGIALSVSNNRPACFSTAIPINPNDKNFPKLCITAQMFSLAQKWAWACLDQDDVPSAVFRMPCSYANLLTLNLESHDVIGTLKAIKMMIRPDWPWLKCILIATKLMVVNDPAALEQGTQGAITCALLAHLNNQDQETRRNLLIESLKVSEEDVRSIIADYLSKLVDPSSCWYSVVSHGSGLDKLTERLKEFGFTFNHLDLKSVCTTL